MKLTESMLRKIIKEEVQAVLNEAKLDKDNDKVHKKNVADFGKKTDEEVRNYRKAIPFPEGIKTAKEYQRAIGVPESPAEGKLARALRAVDDYNRAKLRGDKKGPYADAGPTP